MPLRVTADSVNQSDRAARVVRLDELRTVGHWLRPLGPPIGLDPPGNPHGNLTPDQNDGEARAGGGRAQPAGRDPRAAMVV